MITVSRLYLLVLLCLFVQGCSSNWPHPYNSATPVIPEGTPGVISVFVKDLRPTSNLMGLANKDMIVGEIKTITSSKYPIITKTRNSLAKDMASAICDGFRQKSWQCYPEVSTFKGTVVEEVPSIAAKFKSDQIVFLLINQFYTNVGSKAELNYNLGVTFWSGEGEFLASIGEEGLIPLTPLFFGNPAELASKEAPKKLQEILSKIFNSEPALKSFGRR